MIHQNPMLKVFMANRNFVSRWIRLIVIAVFSVIMSVAAKIERMDIFDKDGNHLLFVNFEYSPNEINIGRSIYTADSTFLRRTVFDSDNADNREKEISLNFNDDTIGYTHFAKINNNPAITVLDQFKLDQFGAAVSFAENGANMYEVHHNGSVIYKMKYTYTAEGELDRIDVLNPENEVLYYARFVIPVLNARDHSRRQMNKQTITLSANRYSFSACLGKRRHLKVCIYDVSGRLVSVPFDKKLNPGVHNEHFMSSKHASQLAGGLYIFRLYIDGKPSGTSQKCILKMRGIR